jgi:hypothetical protein
MSTITSGDATRIFYKGRPVIFSHGWPLSAEAWDAQTQADVFNADILAFLEAWVPLP